MPLPLNKPVRENQKWSHEEYLLTLSLYFKTSPKERDKKNQKVIEMAARLKRTPSSVVYRLANYASVDPSATTKGLNHGGKKVMEIFKKYSNQKEALLQLVEDITQGTLTENQQFWVEQYWPGPRDLDNLFAWFHEKNIQRDKRMKTGDRVLIYEVGWHPETKERGAKKLFASATVLSKREKIDIVSGGKRWVLKRFLETDFVVPPEQGIPISRIKEIRAKKGWPQRGFAIDKKTFLALEDEVRGRAEQHNAKITQKRQEAFSDFKQKIPASFSSSKLENDPAEKIAKLEKSSNSHKEILNKLSSILKEHGFLTKESKQMDLIANINGNDWIFEVKSTRDDNYLGQIRHGIVQLFEYRFRFFKSDVKLCLVVQTVIPVGLEWLTHFLSEHSISLCWPIPNGFFVATGGVGLEFLKGNIETESMSS